MKLTYIGPESQGPHYTESGKRPYGIAFWCNVMYGGKVIPAQYYSTTDTFRDATGCRIEPVCWWHLPAAAPMTEREWWIQKYTDEGCDFISESKFKDKLYGYNDMRAWDGWQERFADLLTRMYNEWVATGRP